MTDDGSRAPRPTSALLVGLAICAVLVSAVRVTVEAGGGVPADLGYLAVMIGAAAVALWHVVQHRRSIRSPSALVAAALVAIAVGEILWYAEWWSRGVDPARPRSCAGASTSA